MKFIPNGTGKFRFWCQKVLPLVYDDSLSYYEVLCKLVTFVNNLAERIADAFDEINMNVQEYVYNWLDAHPEATTTVQDHSITEAKLTQSLLAKLENGYVTPEMFGAVGDGITDDTEAVQSAFDDDLDVLMTGIYHVTKQTSSQYPNNDAPCLIVRKSKNIVGGTLIVNEHAQTAIDVRADNVLIDSVTIQGYGSFPEVGTSGRGEKGASGEGYWDASLSPTHQFSTMRNNSLDTSLWRGFEGNDNHVWGTFGNGFIANCGSGIWIFGCHNVSVRNCKISGFNFEGVTIGIRDNYSTDNVSVTNCDISNCYTSGIGTYNAKEIEVSNNNIRNIGHPTVLANPFNYNRLDPGYGVTFSCYQQNSGDSYLRSEHVNCTLNKIENVVRCGLDVHGGNAINLSLNYIKNAYAFACECGSFSGTGQTINVDLTKNMFIGCNVISFRNSETFVNGYHSNWCIKDNILFLHSNYYRSYGAIDAVIAGLGNVEIIGNRVNNVEAETLCMYVNADYTTIKNNRFNNGILKFYIPHGVIEGNLGYAYYESLSEHRYLCPIYKDGMSATADSKYVRFGETEHFYLHLNEGAIVEQKGSPFRSVRVNESGATWANLFTGIPAEHFNMISVSGYVAGNRQPGFIWYEDNGEVVVFMQVIAGGANADASLGYDCKFCIEYEIV